MASIFIGTNAKRGNKWPIDWFGKFEATARTKVKKLQDTVLDKVRRKFSVKSSMPSQPGGYPHYISGQARNSIQVTDLSNANQIMFAITTPQGTHEGDKIPRLTQGYRIPVKSKPLAIPVSHEAKLASARGVGPRQAFGDRLSMRRGKNGTMVLVETIKGLAASARLAGRELQSRLRGLKGQLEINAKKMQVIQVHYVLRFKPSVIKPRKGIKAAVEECMSDITAALGGTWS